MAKSKLSLTAKPTFTALVPIPIPGGEAISVEFTFKGRTRDQYRVFLDELTGKEDLEVVMEIISGWGLEDAFDATNVDLLLTNYLGAPRAIIDTYFHQLTQARLGN